VVDNFTFGDEKTLSYGMEVVVSRSQFDRIGALR